MISLIWEDGHSLLYSWVEYAGICQNPDSRAIISFLSPAEHFVLECLQGKQFMNGEKYRKLPSLYLEEFDLNPVFCVTSSCCEFWLPCEGSASWIAHRFYKAFSGCQCESRLHAG
jgi:hypothetical protein